MKPLDRLDRQINKIKLWTDFFKSRLIDLCSGRMTGFMKIKTDYGKVSSECTRNSTAVFVTVVEC